MQWRVLGARGMLAPAGLQLVLALFRL